MTSVALGSGANASALLKPYMLREIIKVIASIIEIITMNYLQLSLGKQHMHTDSRSHSSLALDGVPLLCHQKL